MGLHLQLYLPPTTPPTTHPNKLEWCNYCQCETLIYYLLPPPPKAPQKILLAQMAVFICSIKFTLLGYPIIIISLIAEL